MSEGDSSRDDIWIGLRRLANGDDWFTRRSGQPFPHENDEKSRAWASVEPYGDGPCASFDLWNRSRDLYGRLHDWSCTRPNIDFIICEIPYAIATT